MKDTIGLILNIFLNSLPIISLRYLIYWRQPRNFRLSRGAIIACYCSYFLAEIVFFLWLNGKTALTHSHVQNLKLLLALPLFVLPFLFIREQFFKGLLLFVLVSLYNLVVTRTVTFLDLRFFGSDLLFANYFTQSILLFFLLALTIVPMAQFLLKVIRPAFETLHPDFWRLFFFIPGMFLFIFFLYIIDYTSASMGSFRSILMILAVLLGVLSACYILIRIQRLSLQQAKLAFDMEKAHQLIDLQGNQYLEFIKNAETVKAIKHDLRHHLTVIHEFNRTNNQDALAAYLSSILGSIPAITEAQYCDNSTVNALCSSYFSKATELGITLDVRMHVPQDLGTISCVDLCIIFGNLLENAIFACRSLTSRQGYLTVRTQIQSGTFALVVENPFETEICIENGVYLSSRHSGAGVGLASVEAVCQKYDGLLKIQTEHQVFKASVLLMGQL